jgi:AcrR family transcriptional regulator
MLGSGVEKAQSPRPTVRGRKTLAAIEAAARRIIARKGFLAMTVADIAQEAGRSPASFYNYYDSKEDLLAHWADDFRAEAKARAMVVYKHGVPHRERVMESARAHWETYRERLAEMVGVYQFAMINDEFARHWRELCDDAIQSIAESVRRAQREGYCPGVDPDLTARAIVAMLNQFCYDVLAGAGEDAEVDTEAAVRTLGEIWYRAIYWRADQD